MTDNCLSSLIRQNQRWASVNCFDKRTIVRRAKYVRFPLFSSVQFGGCAMNKRRVSIVMTLTVILAIAAPSFAKTKEQKQAEVRKNAHETLARLYKARTSAESTLKAAAGYAAFSNFGMKILLAGGGKAQGIAVDNATKKVTYMKMLEVQAGLGMGIKKFRTIFVFET